MCRYIAIVIDIRKTYSADSPLPSSTVAYRFHAKADIAVLFMVSRVGSGIAGSFRYLVYKFCKGRARTKVV